MQNLDPEKTAQKKQPNRNPRISKAEMERRVNAITDVILMGFRRREIIQFATEKKGWDVTERQIDKYIQAATEEIKQAAKHNRQLELGKTSKRLEHLYQRNIAIQDFKAALAVVREINAIMGLSAADILAAEQAGIGSGIDMPTEPVYLNALQIAPSFYKVYQDIVEHKHTEYVLKGGRGSTKSSFTSEVIITLLMSNPNTHALATRQVANTMRDSVYSQLMWAINYMGLDDKFKGTTSPLEITYLPTGQKIYFRGGDDPMKIKSIKPKFGNIGILWFEELDQFHGAAATRSITQSALRGGDVGWIFKTFNPPRTINNWVHKDLAIPNKNRYIHESDYTTVPESWLGASFLEIADQLKEANKDAYEHEYLGIANSAGGMIFENVEIRKITDDEIYGELDPTTGKRIGGFDRIYNGLDWGFYPDPAHYTKCHYDAARRTLYIFGELRRWKVGNRELYDAMVEYGYNPQDTLIPDSAEPKSIADFRDYGAIVRGAEKGADSVDYSMKWLQSLNKIVIDNERAPYSAEEFLSYEYERNKEDEIITGYPDKNNHAIDATRYATNRIWIRRGQ